MDLAEVERELYEDLNGYVESVARADEGLRLGITCDDWRAHGRRMRFGLLCKGATRWTTTVGPVGWLKILGSHPVLVWETAEQAEIYFSTRPARPHEVVGRLHEQLARSLEGWRPPWPIVTVSSESLAAGNGLLARGPLPVLLELQAAVSDLLKTNLLRSRTSAPSTRKQALILETTYVICDAVELDP